MTDEDEFPRTVDDNPTRSTEPRRPHVVALCGSRRTGSYTRRALQVVLASVEDTGGTTELIDLATLDLPVLDPDRADVSDGEFVTRRLRQADAIVIGTPTYHGSYSGVVKNAIDYAGFDEFEDAIVGLLAVAGGPFPTTALDHLRAVCRSLHAWVLPHEVAVPNAAAAFDDGGIVDADIEDRLQRLGTLLVRHAPADPSANVLVPSRSDMQVRSATDSHARSATSRTTRCEEAFSEL